MRGILIKIQRRELEPQEAIEYFVRMGPEKQEKLLLVLSALYQRQITLTEAKEALTEEKVEYEDGYGYGIGSHEGLHPCGCFTN